MDKEWNDEEDADGIRPDSITVELIKNGEATGQELILSEESGWSGSFSGLRVYPQDAQDDYTVSEVSVEGYTTEISGDAQTGYKIINTHTPEEPEPNVEEPGPVIGNPGGSNPDSTGGTQTGDTNLTYLWILLIIAAAAFIVAGVIFRTRPRAHK